MALQKGKCTEWNARASLINCGLTNYPWSPDWYTPGPISVALLDPTSPLSWPGNWMTQKHNDYPGETCKNLPVMIGTKLKKQTSIKLGTDTNLKGWRKRKHFTSTPVFWRGWILDAIKFTTCHKHHIPPTNWMWTRITLLSSVHLFMWVVRI